MPGREANCTTPSLTARHQVSSSVFNLVLISASDGRDTIADLTKQLVYERRSKELPLDDVNVEFIDARLNEIFSNSETKSARATASHKDTNEKDASEVLVNSSALLLAKPEPDILFIFGPHVTLDEYPPWQIRLTEIFCAGQGKSRCFQGHNLVEYRAFLKGLYQYSRAEMRFGR